MKRLMQPMLFALIALGLAACAKQEEAAPKAKAPVELVAPQNGDDAQWKEYLGKVVAQNMAGVTDRVFPYYLPAGSTAPNPEDREGKSMYDRQLENVASAVQRTVLPGNMLAFGSPDSATMANLIEAAFNGAKADALSGSQVLFIGKPEDNERVRAAVEAAGARYIFVEVK